MSLEDWLKAAWLTEHRPSAQEISDLLTIVSRDLRDCQSPGLSADWRMSIAYNAALQIAMAGLAAEGYRVARDSHHFRAIQSLGLTLGCSSSQVAQLDLFRKKRNISDYERAGSVSDGEAEGMVALAGELRAQLMNWLSRVHPELVATI